MGIWEYLHSLLARVVRGNKVRIKEVGLGSAFRKFFSRCLTVLHEGGDRGPHARQLFYHDICILGGALFLLLLLGWLEPRFGKVILIMNCGTSYLEYLMCVGVGVC